MDDDEELRDLRKELMQADIANKRSDTALKDEQRRWEPWKALSAAFGAGVAVASGLIAGTAWIVTHFMHQ
jgi:F0F1-type ATP synthase assembly protein I